MSGVWALAAACVLVSLIELDVVQVGQTMLSRPLVLGMLLGLGFGDPRLGLLLGAYIELLSVDDLPMGDKIPLNATVALAAAFLLSWGPRGLPCEAALPAGLGLGWAHRWLENLWRVRRRSFCLQAERLLGEGRRPSLGRLIGISLAQEAAGTLALMLAAVFCLGPVLRHAWIQSPAWVAEGFGFAWLLAPWLGLGSLLYAVKVRP